ncbi:MAG: ATP phosphoribosyltransferase regulatory subunit, partial [bacterium]
MLADAGAKRPSIDLADARILKGLLASVDLAPPALRDIVESLSRKDASSLSSQVAGLPEPARGGLMALLDLFGGAQVLQRARRLLPQHALITAALEQLEWLAQRLEA